MRTSLARGNVVGDTANVRVFKQITTEFATNLVEMCCWRYCKCTSFQANHNWSLLFMPLLFVVGDTANVRVFKQITTRKGERLLKIQLLAILQMYEFSSKSQHIELTRPLDRCCWRYCKCTSFQANHNSLSSSSCFSLLLAILQMYEFSSKSQP